MSRLIDADALLQEFETENVAHNSDIWHITGIKAFIENQPTAFDTEKVVEQLEEEKHKRLMFEIESNEEYEKQYFNGTRNGLADAIDIVKKGGLA